VAELPTDRVTFLFTDIEGSYRFWAARCCRRSRRVTGMPLGFDGMSSGNPPYPFWAFATSVISRYSIKTGWDLEAER
jgi:hypothetical protein